jgi:hypothetical protein
VHGLKKVFRVPVNITEKDFEKSFLLMVKEMIGENPFE